MTGNLTLQQRIDTQYAILTSANATPLERGQAQAEMFRLIAQRTPEEVRAMEIKKGIAPKLQLVKPTKARPR